MFARTPSVIAGSLVGAGIGATDESGSGIGGIAKGIGRGAVIGAKEGYREAPIAYATMASGVGDFGKDLLPGVADAVVGIPGALYGAATHGSFAKGYSDAAEAAKLGKSIDWLQEMVGWNRLMRSAGRMQDNALEREKVRRYGKSGPSGNDVYDWNEYVGSHDRARKQTALLASIATPSIGLSSMKLLGNMSKSDKIAKGMSAMDDIAGIGVNADNALRLLSPVSVATPVPIAGSL